MGKNGALYCHTYNAFNVTEHDRQHSILTNSHTQNNFLYKKKNEKVFVF